MGGGHSGNAGGSGVVGTWGGVWGPWTVRLRSQSQPAHNDTDVK